MTLRKIFAASVLSTGMMSFYLAGMSAPAFAGSGDTTFNVNATVAGSCTISATNAALGAYDPGSNSFATATITYQCTPGLSPAIALDAGQNGGGNPDSRAMSDGASDFLTYNIYQDPSHSTVWGFGADGSPAESVNADGNADNVTAYVAMSPGQSSAPEGSYSDTVTATINW